MYPRGITHEFFFLFFFEIRKREMYISRTEERKRDTNFFSSLMKIGWEFKRARVDQEKKKYVSRRARLIRLNTCLLARYKV